MRKDGLETLVGFLSTICEVSHDLKHRENQRKFPDSLEPLDHLQEESGCDFVAVYILQDRCRREIEDSALVR